jgi:Zn-dependent M28 family amino/carboxypeptidase
MGSCVHANNVKAQKQKVVGMLSLEMLGVYSDAPNSQKYPHPFNLFYPTTANFIGFVGNTFSRSLVRSCVKTFRTAVNFPCEGVAAPDSVKDVARSDHWAFWQIGVPALMVTDTSNFRYPTYHTQGDKLDQLDFDRMTMVTAGVFAVVRQLGG